jgi:hypothetical protein
MVIDGGVEGIWWRGSGTWRGGDTPCDPSSRKPSGTYHTHPFSHTLLMQPFSPHLTSTST